MLIKAGAIDSAIATVKAHRRQDSFQVHYVKGGWARAYAGHGQKAPCGVNSGIAGVVERTTRRE